MNKLIIYAYENYTLTVLINEDDEIVNWDTADDAMWSIENSFNLFFGEEKAEQLYNFLVQNTINEHLHEFDLYDFQEYIFNDELSLSLIEKGIKFIHQK